MPEKRPALIMEKDNFLQFLNKARGIDAEELRTELNRTPIPDDFQAAILSAVLLSNVSENNPADLIIGDGKVFETLNISPNEFEQGVFMKIKLKTLPEATVPPNFTEQVLNRVSAQKSSVSISKVSKRIAAAIIASTILICGITLSFYTYKQNSEEIKYENKIENKVVKLPEIKSETIQESMQPSNLVSRPAMPNSKTKDVRVEKKNARVPPEKGDPTLQNTDGPTPED